MKLRLILAVWACKLGIIASRLLGKKGTSMPGQIAFKICPDVLKLLSAQVKKDIVVVCGTNGKTTTNNMLSAFVKSKGKTVVCNALGANMIWGVCCAFAERSNLFGKLKADYACLEVDEASCLKVFRHVKPTLVAITNLFQDQLDRYGEVSLTADLIKRALELAPEASLLLNGDDPLVAQFGENTQRTCYYMGVCASENQEEIEGASQFCPLCGKTLHYDYRHYGQLGKFSCAGCGFARKDPDFRVFDVNTENGLSFSLKHGESVKQFAVQYRGFYNIYNIVLSYAASVLALGEEPDHQAVLAAYQPQIGRMEEFFIPKKVILNLAKNPAGFNQAITTVVDDKAEKDLLLALNDHESDGMDISWLWDVAFEKLMETPVRKLVLTGIRADELSLRLKYAGFPEERQEVYHDLKQAAQALVSGDGDVAYALVNYTVVFPMQAILKEMEGEQNHGA